MPNRLRVAALATLLLAGSSALVVAQTNMHRDAPGKSEDAASRTGTPPAHGLDKKDDKSAGHGKKGGSSTSSTVGTGGSAAGTR